MSESASTIECLLEAKDLLLDSGARCSFSAKKGEAVWIPGAPPDLHDVLSGLARPQAGEVLFEGRAWDELDPFSECRKRAAIGRVLPPDRAWIENLSLGQNISLRVLHAGSMSPDQARGRIAELAGIFNVSSELAERPEGIAPSVLERCQWIRALLAQPAIVLFDDAESAVKNSHISQLRNQLRQYLADGGLLIWGGATPLGGGADLGVRSIKRISSNDNNSKKEI